MPCPGRRYMFSVYVTTCRMQPNPDAWELQYTPRRPLYTTQEALDALVNSHDPLHLHTSNNEDEPFRTAMHGWEAKEDVKGKLGLIANEVGASVTYVFPPELLQKHAPLFGYLHVVHLRSYASMGIMRVRVYALPPQQPATDRRLARRLGASSEEKVKLAEAVVDTLWLNRVSVPQIAELKWNPSLVPPGSGLQIKVEVVAPAPSDFPRKHHKVKLIEMVLY